MMNTATADFTCFFTQRLPFLTRTVRVTYRSTSATCLTCGNRAFTQSGASITWMVRRSRRPWPFSSVACCTGTRAQSSASSSSHSRGVFRFTKRATNYDVSVPCCRARWWSRR